MTHSTCSSKTRKSIGTDIKQKLLRYSSFSCSICGKIPVVFHHIEEWSKRFSNDEKYIIPICDTCHRSIHGEGGPIYSKKELYEYKSNPKKPDFLRYKYHLENKPNYSFFVGSNFVANGKKATLIKISEFPLTTIDASLGVLRLSILSGVEDNKPSYLIKDNELIVNTSDIWKMKFSIPTLKIWKIVKNKKIVFIDITIKPGVIIIKNMNTEFNGKPFRIYRPSALQGHQIEKINNLIKEGEKYYKKYSKLIDKQPETEGILNGVNIDKFIKENRKDALKRDIEFKLRDIIDENFKKMDSYSRYFMLDKALEKSPVFKRQRRDFNKRFDKLSKAVAEIKRKHRKEFKELNDIVIDYNGMILSGNLVLSM